MRLNLGLFSKEFPHVLVFFLQFFALNNDKKRLRSVDPFPPKIYQNKQNMNKNDKIENRSEM